MYFSGHANNRSETEQQRKLNKTEIVSRHACHTCYMSHISHVAYVTCHLSAIIPSLFQFLVWRHTLLPCNSNSRSPQNFQRSHWQMKEWNLTKA